VARIRRSDCSTPGIRRLVRGRGFQYLDDQSGKKIADAEALARIAALAVPPAWTDVWICPDPCGHLQAVGTDDAGRRQYRYHDRWLERRAQQKFDQMLSFARALPQIRAATDRHLRRSGLQRDRVLAGAVRLLDLGFFRIGSEEYAEENGTFGLATMRRRHARLEPRGVVVFDYPAKGKKRHVQAVADRRVYRLVRELKERQGGGAELLVYLDGEGWRDVRSRDINDYLKEVGGEGFTAKDFRTWAGTVLAVVALARAEPPTSESGRSRAISRSVAEVADLLGNTPQVARAAYIDPRVLDRFREGRTIRPAPRACARRIARRRGDPRGDRVRCPRAVDLSSWHQTAGAGSRARPELTV
jgi:DNA topoisomerase I